MDAGSCHPMSLERLRYSVLSLPGALTPSLWLLSGNWPEELTCSRVDPSQVNSQCKVPVLVLELQSRMYLDIDATLEFSIIAVFAYFETSLQSMYLYMHSIPCGCCFPSKSLMNRSQSQSLLPGSCYFFF